MTAALGNRCWLSRLGRVTVAAAIGLSLSAPAAAEVTRKGDWPESDPSVSLDLEMTSRNEALKRLAAEAGWSLLLDAPPGDPVELHVKDQPAGKVLDMLLSDRAYVARRDGTLIAIAPAMAQDGVEVDASETVDIDVDAIREAAREAREAAREQAREAREQAREQAHEQAHEHHEHGRAHDEERGRDRAVTGNSLRIDKGEVVHDVSVFGGSLVVFGKVTGDISVMGGSVYIHDGAVVRGDLSTVGGALTLEDGSRVDGDVDVVGGSLKRGDKAIIGGDVSTEGVPNERRGGDHQEADDEHAGFSLSTMASEAGEAVTRTALWFVFGAVLLALASRRMELLRVDVASRPMKSFALGIVGILTGLAVLVALCVTVIGIPFAVIGILLAFFAALAGACSVLETAGAAVLGHRTKNPYMHLAAGCFGLLLFGAIPYVGTVLYIVVFLIGIGAIVSTRAAGLIRPRQGVGPVAGAHPFRSAA